MYNTSASELESVANDLGQIARSYNNAAQELDQQVITLEGAVAHVLSDGVMQWKGLSSEAFVSAWLERRVRLKQASTLMSESATQMTTLAQTIESNIAMIRAGQSIQLQPIFATMPSNEQQSVLDGVSQAQNAIFTALAALNSQLEAMAEEVSNCPEVDREAGTPGYYDNAKNYAAADTGEGDGTDGGDGSADGVDVNPYTGGEDQTDLINQLKKSGKKFNEKDIVGITETPDGKIDWIEKGSPSAGLDHIMNGDGTPGDIGHGNDFANIGVNGEQNVVKLIIDTLHNETPIEVKASGAQVFNVPINGVSRRIQIIVGSNGFVVTANPL